MKRDIITIPPGLLSPTDMNWRIDWRGATSREANDGVSQMIINSFPRWVGSPTVVLMGDNILRWRAINARARGQANLYRVELCHTLGFNITGYGAGYLLNGVPLSTSSMFATGKGLAYMPFATCVAGAAKGATEFTVAMEDFLPDPKVGQIMSFDDRPFIVVAVEYLGSRQFALEIEMPLRIAIPLAGLIDLRPHGVFEAANDAMGNPSYGLIGLSQPKLNFQEYLNR